MVREFGEAEGEDSAFYDKLARLLPEFIKLYDHIYLTLPDSDPAFPWADGKPPSVAKRKKAVSTPLLSRSCSSKVSGAFIWPVFSAFRLLLEDTGDGLLFKTIRSGSSTRRGRNWHPPSRRRSRIRGRVTQQVGKAPDAWIRLESQIQMEMMIRDRLAARV